jgi:hypothetical protein
LLGSNICSVTLTSSASLTSSFFLAILPRIRGGFINFTVRFQTNSSANNASIIEKNNVLRQGVVPYGDAKKSGGFFA